MKNKTVTGWLIAVAGPLLVASVYLLFSRWPVRWWSAVFDYAALVVAVLVGVVGVCIAIQSPVRRIVCSAAYTCVAALGIACLRCVRRLPVMPNNTLVPTRKGEAPLLAAQRWR
jgi:hypothetical protein